MLYSSRVIPTFLCCAEIWRPYLKKHIDALESVQRRFIRRVSARCEVPRQSVVCVLKTISELHEVTDLKMFYKFERLNMLDQFVIIRGNYLRSGRTISPIETARTERINNTFAWRLARKVR